MNPTAQEKAPDAQKESEARTRFQEIAENLHHETPGYDKAAAWAAASSLHPEGRKMFAEWKRQIHLKNGEALAQRQAERRASGGGNYECNAMAPPPVKNPRSVALVGLTMSASDEEFAQAWERFQEKGVVKTPTAPAAAATEKDDPERGFMSEVSKLQAKLHDYQSAWQIASITEPGKGFYQLWQKDCQAKKLSGELKPKL